MLKQIMSPVLSQTTPYKGPAFILKAEELNLLLGVIRTSGILMSKMYYDGHCDPYCMNKSVFLNFESALHDLQLYLDSEGK